MLSQIYEEMNFIESSKRELRIFFCFIFLAFGCTAQQGEKTAEEIYFEFTAPEVTDEVYQHFQELISDSLRMEIRSTSDENRYFKVLIQLQDSVVTEAFVQCRNKEMSEETLRQIEKYLVGTKPNYGFIDRFQYGGYSFVIDKNAL